MLWGAAHKMDEEVRLQSRRLPVTPAARLGEHGRQAGMDGRTCVDVRKVFDPASRRLGAAGRLGPKGGRPG